MLYSSETFKHCLFVTKHQPFPIVQIGFFTKSKGFWKPSIALVRRRIFDRNLNVCLAQFDDFINRILYTELDNVKFMSGSYIELEI